MTVLYDDSSWFVKENAINFLFFNSTLFKDCAQPTLDGATVQAMEVTATRSAHAGPFNRDCKL